MGESAAFRLLAVALFVAGALKDAPLGAQQTAVLSVSPPTIAHLRLVVPRDLLDDPRSVQSVFDTLLTAALDSRRCRRISSVRADSVLDWVTDSAGGWFDRNTGELDTARYAAVLRSTLAKLHVNLGVGATLFPRVDYTSATVKNGIAKWDGASQGVGFRGNGQVPATRFALFLLDTAETTQAVGLGGIEILAKGSIWNSDLKRRPAADLFQDRDRDTKAVRLALDSLLPRLAAAGYCPT